MSFLSKIFSRWWLIALIGAGGFVLWSTRARIQRIEYVSGLVGRIEATKFGAVNVSAGYAGVQRSLIVPERNENSYHWIAQTQQMFARGEWRVRRIDYENAPFGREVSTPSPYRWWLGFMAWLDHLQSDRPIGLAVEHAALGADPALHLLFVCGAGLFVAWRFGGLAAGLLTVGLVTFFPLAAGFLPGAPDAHGLATLCALGSTLILLAGVMSTARAVGWFFLAGCVGGLGLWVSVSTQVPIISGIFIGGLVAAWLTRQTAPQKPPVAALPWRSWALGGSATVLVAYLVEYFPNHLGDWRLETLHPLYALAWLGLGELLTRLTPLIQREKRLWQWRDWIAVSIGLVAVAVIPVLLWKTESQGFLALDLTSVRLTGLSDGVVAANFWSWLQRDGATGTVWATVLPVIALLPALWLLLHRSTPQTTRLALAIGFGPVIIALGFASRQLGWWTVLDGMLLVLLVVATARVELSAPQSRGWLWSSGVAVLALLGVTQLYQPTSLSPGMALTASESQQLIDRHLAHWLVQRTGEAGAVVYAPPHQTAALDYFGGLRGIGTFTSENRAGFGATLMIAGVKTMDEVQGLLVARGIRYLIIPSWDPFFEQFAQRYLAKEFSNRTSFLVNELRHWNLPPWLRPVPYQLPVGGGYEDQSVLVFEVVEEQGPAVAAGRLAEYLIETGRLDQAKAMTETLRRFPGDLGALAARAQVELEVGEGAAAEQTVKVLVARLSGGADRFLPWDRRLSLAVVLARTEQITLAREQTRRCVTELNEAKLRSLSTGSLYHLLVLSNSFEVKIADPRLNQLARELLPADLRDKL